MSGTVEMALVLTCMLIAVWILGTIGGRWLSERRWRRKREQHFAQTPTPCCPADVHRYCPTCLRGGHIWGAWKSQRTFAFEEKVCACCGHAESRMLPLGEEEI